MKCFDMEKNHGDIKSYESLVLHGDKSDIALKSAEVSWLLQ